MDACLAAVQMKCRSGDVEWNLKKAESLIEQASGGFMDGGTVICLPELFATGYSLSRKVFAQLAESIPGRMVDRLSSWAQGFGAFIHAGIAEEGEAGAVYDSSVLISPQGKLLGKYRKIHLAGAYEKGIFRPGREVSVVPTKIGGMGLMICYDQVFSRSRPEARNVGGGDNPPFQRMVRLVP